MTDIILATESSGDLSSFRSERLQRNPAHSYLVKLRSDKSRQTATSILNVCADILGKTDYHNLPWERVNDDHVAAIVSILKDDRNLAPATVNTYLSIIKGVMRECWRKRLIDVETLERIRSVDRVRGSRISKGRSISKDEMSSLLEVCDDGTVIGIRDSAILAVLMGCGLRRSEVVSLNWENVDTTERSIKVVGKGDKERISFLPDGTWRRLMDWVNDVRGDGAGPLFVRIRKEGDVTSSRLTSQGVYHIIDSRRIQAGVKPLSPHDLRRTFATTLLLNGEDILTVKDAMGHANIATTQKYDKRGDERLKEARNRMVIE